MSPKHNGIDTLYVTPTKVRGKQGDIKLQTSSVFINMNVFIDNCTHS